MERSRAVPVLVVVVVVGGEVCPHCLSQAGGAERGGSKVGVSLSEPCLVGFCFAVCSLPEVLLLSSRRPTF